MSNKQHIIFVHSLFYPDHSAASQILTDLAFYLADNDFKVSVITSRKMYHGNGSQLKNFEKINEVNIYRQWSLSLGKTGFIKRLIDYVSLEISMVLKIIRFTKRYDTVIFLTDPPLLSLIATPIILIKGAYIVNWLQDLYPEVAVSVGILAQKSLVNKILKKIRNSILNKANMNVVIGQHMFNYLIENNVELKKIQLIPNWANSDDLVPVLHQDNPLREEWGLQDKFVVGYSGNLGKAHDFLTISNAIKLLQDSSNICFLFIGGGSGMDALQNHCEEKGYKNVIFKPYQPRKFLRFSLSLSDVHWVTLEPKMESFIVPSKIYGLLATAKPIIFIGHKNGEIAHLINKASCGKIINQGDSNKLAITIVELSKDLDLVSKMGNCGREEFKKNYDFHISANKFSKLIFDFKNP